MIIAGVIGSLPKWACCLQLGTNPDSVTAHKVLMVKPNNILSYPEIEPKTSFLAVQRSIVKRTGICVRVYMYVYISNIQTVGTSSSAFSQLFGIGLPSDRLQLNTSTPNGAQTLNFNIQQFETSSLNCLSDFNTSDFEYWIVPTGKIY